MSVPFMAGKKLTVEEWLKLYGDGAEFTAKKSKEINKNKQVCVFYVVEAFHPNGRPSRVKLRKYDSEESANQYVFFLRIHYEEAV